MPTDTAKKIILSSSRSVYGEGKYHSGYEKSLSEMAATGMFIKKK